VPELPDLVHIESMLARTVCGLPIVEARVGDPVVLRIMVREPFPALLMGQHIQAVKRIGQFLRFSLDGDLVLVVNAMLTGRYRWLAAGQKRSGKGAGKDLILALHFDDGSELYYLDETRMGKIYVAHTQQTVDIPGLSALGVDLLSPAFTLEHFRTLAANRRDQVRQFLLDKSALASIGNAYADEILFAARLHPKTFCKQLTAEDNDRLFAAIRDTLAWAIREIETRNQPIDIKLRDFLKVRGRAGQLCPCCGTVIRRVRVGRDDASFCPTCQPATRKLFVDFSKLPSKAKPPC
jgi:formamidopyrimidine-DNA glycosylase